MSSRFANSLTISAPKKAWAAGPLNLQEQLGEEVTALFDEFRETLLRYLRSFGLATTDGEEVLQEVFLSLFQHLDRGKSIGNVRAWLFRVTHNIALKRRYQTRRDSEARAEAVSQNWAADPDPNPEERLVQNQTRERLLAVVAALPEPDRRCLFLRAEGLRYREIGAILEMSLGAVSISLARSLARIACSADR